MLGFPGHLIYLMLGQSKCGELWIVSKYVLSFQLTQHLPSIKRFGSETSKKEATKKGTN